MDKIELGIAMKFALFFLFSISLSYGSFDIHNLSIHQLSLMVDSIEITEDINIAANNISLGLGLPENQRSEQKGNFGKLILNINPGYPHIIPKGTRFKINSIAQEKGIGIIILNNAPRIISSIICLDLENIRLKFDGKDLLDCEENSNFKIIFNDDAAIRAGEPAVLK